MLPQINRRSSKVAPISFSIISLSSTLAAWWVGLCEESSSQVAKAAGGVDGWGGGGQ